MVSHETKKKLAASVTAAILAVPLVLAACAAPAAPSATPPQSTTVPPTVSPQTSTPEGSTEPTEPDIMALIPDGAEILSQASVDLDGDGRLEYVVLAGFGGSPDRLGYDWLQIFVVEPDRADYAIAWQSDRLIGERAEKLKVQDINADGLPEVLSVQSMGASGETLYVVAFLQEAFGFLKPRGGYFGFQESFGDNAVRLEDVDGDAALEILAGYGPMASNVDVYDWVESETDGNGYVYAETRYEVGGPAQPAAPNVDYSFLGGLATILSQEMGDLNGDGVQELVALAGYGDGPNRLGYDAMGLFILEQRDTMYKSVWEDIVPGERAEALQITDINGDGRLEAVSVHSTGAAGESLYVMAWLGDRYDFSRPQGGFFDGKPFFGETGAQLKDIDGDGVAEILATYGPGASQMDVYRWDGKAYIFAETQQVDNFGHD